METEEQIVYSIIETVTKGNLTDDNKINERVVRGFLQIYRASAIAKYSTLGHNITDEFFQYLGLKRFLVTPNILKYTVVLPKMILLKSNYGIMFEVDGENIPVLNSEEYTLSFKNFINKNLPKAKMLGNKAEVFIGEFIMVNGQLRPQYSTLITNLTAQAIVSSNAYVDIEVYGILDNPSNADDYDWTVSPYPCSSELIEEIKTKILAKEFNLILNINSDKVTNSNDDESQAEGGQKSQSRQAQ